MRFVCEIVDYFGVDQFVIYDLCDYLYVGYWVVYVWFWLFVGCVEIQICIILQSLWVNFYEFFVDVYGWGICYDEWLEQLVVGVVLVQF